MLIMKHYETRYIKSKSGNAAVAQTIHKSDFVHTEKESLPRELQIPSP